MLYSPNVDAGPIFLSEVKTNPVIQSITCCSQWPPYLNLFSTLHGSLFFTGEIKNKRFENGVILEVFSSQK